jgi:hypothetical protein
MRMLPRVWVEYDWAAEWVAQRPLMGDGDVGTTLPRNLSAEAKREIDKDPEAFALRVRQFRYAIAMLRHAIEE